jgi:hypothetical protein
MADGGLLDGMLDGMRNGKEDHRSAQHKRRKQQKYNDIGGYKMKR